MTRTTDMSHELRMDFREGYAHQQPPSDAEAYLNVKRYENAGDTTSVDKWLAHFSSTKYNNVIYLLGHGHLPLVSKLNSLCDIPGLWTGVHMGVIHKIRALHCDKVCIHEKSRETS
jgi:hypothetical protein